MSYKKIMPMIPPSFDRLRTLKRRANRANNKVNLMFKLVSGKCKYKKIRYRGKDEWYKCTHKDYPLVPWIATTPCGKEKCPKLR